MPICSKTFAEIFLSLRDPLLATFNKTRAPTSRKCVAKQAILILEILM